LQLAQFANQLLFFHVYMQVADGTHKMLLRTGETNGGYSHQQPPLPVLLQQPIACAAQPIAHSLAKESPFAAASVQAAEGGMAVAEKQVKPHTCIAPLDKDSAWQQQEQQTAAACLPADGYDNYTELHDSDGQMMAYVNRRCSTSFTGHPMQQRQQQQQQQQSGHMADDDQWEPSELQLRRALSTNSTVGKTPTAAESDVMLKQQIFKRAAHHPGSFSVARVPSVTAGAGAAAGLNAADLRAAVLASCGSMGSCTPQHWQQGWERSSVISMTTGATWASTSMARSSSLMSSLHSSMTDNGSSCCEGDWPMYTDLTEAVFEMTGGTAGERREWGGGGSSMRHRWLADTGCHHQLSFAADFVGAASVAQLAA
jgi:hypothetical protein